ncbi:MAG: ABC transporter, partial [Nocardioidaceae bacterium]
DHLVGELVRLREALEGARLPLEVPGVEAQRAKRAGMVDQLEDYVLPRLVQIDAPLLAVVGGSTGAGKSTLVNALIGRTVTEPGILRPTTRSPVLVHNPADADWFDEQRILPGLARTTAASGDPGALRLVATTDVPEGLAILDAPDIDSVEEANRALAAELLGAADLWLFVTSAARYADQVPWEFLKAAEERSAAVAVVLDRTPRDAMEEVSGHLARMLTAQGLRDSPLFVVPEEHLDASGLLPADSVAEIRSWLDLLAQDASARAAVVRQTLQGAIRSLSRNAYVVADAAAEQEEMVRRLRADVDHAYDDAIARIDHASADGTLLRGEVLARWQEFVGTGELLRTLETKVGWVRDRVVAWVRGKPQQAERVSVAVESGLETLVVEHAEAAAEQAEAGWRSVGAGRPLVEVPGRVLGRASRDLRPRAALAIREWQGDLLAMVRTEGADKRSTARFLAYGLNGLSVALMIIVFSQTLGLSGAEVGIAGGSALVSQKLLEAVFGDQAVRGLAAKARVDLHTRVGGLIDGERARFVDVLTGLGVDPATPERVRSAARRIDDLRFAARDDAARDDAAGDRA